MSGVIGALIVGWFLDATALYRKTLITISTVGLMAVISTWLTLAFSSNNLGNIVFSTVAIGFSCVSYFPTCISYGAELTFPM